LSGCGVCVSSARKRTASCASVSLAPSRAEQRPESDVDIVVELREPRLASLIGVLEAVEALLERPVDIVRYHARMNPTLKARIDRDARYA
jgi:predicted nucleotidyltransferase